MAEVCHHMHQCISFYVAFRHRCCIVGDFFYLKIKEARPTTCGFLTMPLSVIGSKTGLCSELMAFKQEGIFIVQYLKRHGILVYTVSSEGPFCFNKSPPSTCRGYWEPILTRVLKGQNEKREIFPFYATLITSIIELHDDLTSIKMKTYCLSTVVITCDSDGKVCSKQVGIGVKNMSFVSLFCHVKRQHMSQKAWYNQVHKRWANG